MFGQSRLYLSGQATEPSRRLRRRTIVSCANLRDDLHIPTPVIWPRAGKPPIKSDPNAISVAHIIVPVVDVLAGVFTFLFPKEYAIVMNTNIIKFIHIHISLYGEYKRSAGIQFGWTIKHLQASPGPEKTLPFSPGRGESLALRKWDRFRPMRCTGI
jgi:hypothetical protein